MQDLIYRGYKMKQKLTFFLLKLAAYFPTRIPVGLTAFEAWFQKIVTLSGLPATEQSMKFTVAQKIMSLPPHKNRISINAMVASLQKAAANEVAAHVFYTLKQQQQEAIQAAQQKAADTAPAQVPDNEQQKA